MVVVRRLERFDDRVKTTKHYLTFVLFDEDDGDDDEQKKSFFFPSI